MFEKIEIQKNTLVWAMNAASYQKLTREQVQALVEYIADGGVYINGFNEPGISAQGWANRFAACHVPDGYKVKAVFWGRGGQPNDSIRIGQYKVRSGDPESPIYIVPA